MSPTGLSSSCPRGTSLPAPRRPAGRRDIGGNCVVLKPANYSEHTSETIIEMISETFDPRYIRIFGGGRDVIQRMLDVRYDFIFFTGGPHLGRIVMEKASRFLTPLALELGGKSPASSRRCGSGRCGEAYHPRQASECRPDLHRPRLFPSSFENQERDDRKDQRCVIRSYGEDPQQSPDYGRIINRNQFESSRV